MTPRSVRAVALVSGLLTFAVYLATLESAVSGGDSGELITVAATLGVAHPPGFPLYVLLAKLFTLLPIESIAWRVNLLSAAAGAAAAMVLCLAVGRWTGRPWAALLATGAFAFSPVVWRGATTAEVFALNNLFAAGLVWLSVQLTFDPASRGRWLPLSALWIGLGLSNQHTLLFLALPFAGYVAYLERARLLDPKRWAPMLAAMLVGLSPYLYLMVASATVPVIGWGDQTSVGGLIAHVLRQDYGTFQLAQGAGHSGGAAFIERLGLFATTFTTGTVGLGPLLILGSFLALTRRALARPLAAFWLSALAFYLVGFCALANLPTNDPFFVVIQERFWQMGIVVAAALMGVGVVEIGWPFSQTGARILRLTVALVLPVGMLITHFGSMRSTESELMHDWASAILAPLEPNAILLTSSDETTGTVRYLNLAERVRPDVTVIPTGLLSRAWYRRFAAKHHPDIVLPGSGDFSALAFLDANLSQRPIYMMNREPWLQTLEERYAAWPIGLPERILRKGETPEFDAWIDQAEASFERFDAERASQYEPGTPPRYVSDIYWKHYARYAFRLPEAARAHADDPAVAARLAEQLERVAVRHPAPEPSVFKNLGVAYQFLSRTRPEATASMVRHWQHYLEVAPPDDRDLEAIRTVVERAAAADTTR